MAAMAGVSGYEPDEIDAGHEAHSPVDFYVFWGSRKFFFFALFCWLGTFRNPVSHVVVICDWEENHKLREKIDCLIGDNDPPQFR